MPTVYLPILAPGEGHAINGEIVVWWKNVPPDKDGQASDFYSHLGRHRLSKYPPRNRLSVDCLPFFAGTASGGRDRSWPALPSHYKAQTRPASKGSQRKG